MKLGEFKSTIKRSSPLRAEAEGGGAQENPLAAARSPVAAAPEEGKAPLPDAIEREIEEQEEQQGESYDLDDLEHEDATLAEQEDDTFSDQLSRALALLPPEKRKEFLQEASQEWEKRKEEEMYMPVAMLYKGASS